MSDPSYSDSEGTSYMEMVYLVNDSDFGILERCPCGSQIIIQISTEAGAIPKKYFVCKDFKNDGLHRKKEWTEAIEDETRRLKTKVGDNESRMRSLGGLEYRIDGIDKASKKNDGVIAHLSYQIDEIDKASKKNADEIALLKAIIEKL
ncbi:hypothetical protein Bca52824_024221 [Brassica carinata]|uniref:Zinc finger GRF-type domain-containing protein n=1 Tax=Brassica carinata TaxID=52824 RepID=A0A8X7VK23_BRACI|nr:hypothetical protein Bca52824_024221 [Brassica carinata]